MLRRLIADRRVGLVAALLVAVLPVARVAAVA